MNYFQKALCVLMLLSLASLVRAQQAFAPTNANDCTLAFFTALADKDAATLRSLVTVDFSMVSFDGRLIDGAALSEALASGYITIERGDVSGTYTRLYGDAGLTTGTWEARGSLQGYTFRNHISFMAVCVRQGGRWKLAGMQLTPQP
jgi:ketosteroid isomerase-like protein